MNKNKLTEIPGVGRTFVKDFERINIFSIDDLVGQNPDDLFGALCAANEAVAHKTSKNYLYVIRMAVYYANGGRDESKLKWHVWKD
ncbi:MAG: hypothetical protein JNK57_14285 [Planctomycetaceae bacterium]|nr:hypothetical protein [Planctomycetaceae bacterium]